MNYSICSISFRHELTSFHKILQFAYELGYQGIELWGIHAQSLYADENQRKDLKAMVEGYGLRISMLCDYIDISQKTMLGQSPRQRMNHLISLATWCGTKKLRIFAGNEPSAHVSSRTWDNWITNLYDLAQMAGDEGIHLVIETHPNTLADTLTSTLRLAHDVCHPNLRINLDFLHLWESGTGALHAIRELCPWIENYHMKNVDHMNSTQVFHPRNVYSPNGDRGPIRMLGDGAIDFGAVVRFLVDKGAEESVGIEWFGDNPFQVLRRERLWLKNAEAGLVIS